MTEYKNILYEAINTANGKRYIGITQRGIKVRQKRHIWTAHSGYGSVFGAAIRKYGAGRFEFKVLAVCPDFEYAKLIEVAAIKQFRPEYNVTAGGDGAVGFKHSEEHKAKMALLQKGKQYALGRSLTEEHKDRIRQSRLAGRGGPRKGQKFKMTPEGLASKRRKLMAYHLAKSYGKQDNSLEG